MDKEAQGENSSSQNVKLFQNEPEPGMLLSVQRIEQLRARAEYVLVKKKALELLGSREHSVNQLRQKLVLRDFTPENIDRVLEDLQVEGSLSNKRFVEVWLRYRLKKHPEGYSALLSGLVKAGITPGEAGELLDLYIVEYNMEEHLERAAGKIMRKNNITREKLLRGLISRGFDFSAVIQFIENHYDK